MNKTNSRSDDAYNCIMSVFFSTTNEKNLDQWTVVFENVSAITINLKRTWNITAIFLVIGRGVLYDEKKHRV